MEMREYSAFTSRKRAKKHEEDKKKRGFATPSPIKKETNPDLLSVMGFPKAPFIGLPTIVKSPPHLSKNQVMANEVAKLDQQDTKNLLEELAEGCHAHNELLAEVDEILKTEVEGEMTVGELIETFWDDFPAEVRLNPPVEWSSFMRRGFCQKKQRTH